MYGQRQPPAEPPCQSCKVELSDTNEEAASVYNMTQNQVISVQNVVVDINHLAIDACMRRLGVRDERTCFNKVVALFHEITKSKKQVMST